MASPLVLRPNAEAAILKQPEVNSEALPTRYAKMEQSSLSQKDKVFICTYADCSKSFTKQCKYDDHLRTHTGERPFKCSKKGCEKAFGRKDHLQRHERSHSAASSSTTALLAKNLDAGTARPYQCAALDRHGVPCHRRFLTRQHLDRHQREFHDRPTSCDEHATSSVIMKKKPYACSIGNCSESFSKRKFLREHINIVHSNKFDVILDETEAAELIRLPFPCTEEGCNKRFSTNSKRNAHVSERHSGQLRYICLEADCESKKFATWKELQSHNRQYHKLTCKIEGCQKMFKNAQDLHNHARARHQVENDVAFGKDEIDFEDDDDKDVKIFPCTWQEGDGSILCTRTFSTKFNRNTHIRTVHKREKAFECPNQGCERRFTSKRASQRHGRKCGSEEHHIEEADVSDNAIEEDLLGDEREVDDDFFRLEGGAVPESNADRPKIKKRKAIELQNDKDSPPMLHEQANSVKKRKLRDRILECPWSRIRTLQGDTTDASCSATFSRLYDVQRHLKARHGGIAISQIEIAALYDEHDRLQLPSPRRGTKLADEFDQEVKEMEEE